MDTAKICIGLNGVGYHMKGCDGTNDSTCMVWRRMKGREHHPKSNPLTNPEAQRVHGWVKLNFPGVIPPGFRGNKMGRPQAKGLLTEQDYQDLVAFLGTDPEPPKSKRLTTEEQAWRDSIRRRPIKRMPGTPIVRKKAEARQRGVEKTDTELTKISSREYDRKCCLCGNPLGGYVFDGRDYTQLGLEHCHVTKIRVEGGMAIDDFPGCTVCQRILGDLKGMPLIVAQVQIMLEHQRRGYKFFKAVVGV